MRTICAWCRAVMARGDGPGDPRVSHGMCAACAQLTDAVRDRLLDRWLERHGGWEETHKLRPTGAAHTDRLVAARLNLHEDKS